MHTGLKDRLMDAARNGHRVTLNGKQIWAGLGNRSGLHHFLHDILEEKFVKGRTRYAKILDGAKAGDEFTILEFVNETRDRGLWMLASRHSFQ